VVLELFDFYRGRDLTKPFIQGIFEIGEILVISRILYCFYTLNDDKKYLTEINYFIQ